TMPLFRLWSHHSGIVRGRSAIASSSAAKGTTVYTGSAAPIGVSAAIVTVGVSSTIAATASRRGVVMDCRCYPLTREMASGGNPGKRIGGDGGRHGRARGRRGDPLVPRLPCAGLFSCDDGEEAGSRHDADANRDGTR